MRFLRLAVLASVAAVLFALADALFSWNPVMAAIYRACAREPVFRHPPALGFGFAAEIINGWIAVLAFILIEPGLARSSWRKGILFGLILWGFWVVSGTMSATVWLALPWQVALANVAFGLPKCLFIGCGIAWYRTRQLSARRVWG